MRDLFLFLHIIGAAGWIGGGLYGYFAYPTVTRTGPPAAAPILKGFDRWGGAYFGVTSGLVLLSGIALVLASDAFGWDDAFVLIGLGAFLFTGIMQGAVGRKANERLTAAAETGTDIPHAVNWWRRTSLIDLLVLFFVVWAMVTKLGA
jgi:hypothetical protein